MTVEPAVNEWPAHGTRLMLLGTVHGDPRGFRRLHRFLEIHQPDLILIELSPFGWAFRKVNQIELNRTLTEHLRAAAKVAGYPWHKALAHPEIRAIRRQIALPFEYRASRRYVRAHDKRLLLVDRSSFSQALVATWPDLLSTTNLALLLTVPPSRQRRAVEEQYRRAHAHLRAPSGKVERFRSTTECSQEEVWQERERSLAERVREAILTVVPPSCVYVGGWEHLSNRDNPKSLRRLLGTAAATYHVLDYYDPRGIARQ
jgi:hypothetical protein